MTLLLPKQGALLLRRYKTKWKWSHSDSPLAKILKAFEKRTTDFIKRRLILITILLLWAFLELGTVMAHLSKQERQIGIKTSPDKFYSFFRDNKLRFPHMFQSYVKSFELVGGGTQIKSGSITRWTYCLGMFIFLFYIYSMRLAGVNSDFFK